MASTIPPILIQLQADVTQLKKGLADAESAIKGVDSNVKKASTGMTNFVGTLKKVGAAMGATFAAAQVANFAKQSVMAASNMEESLSKVRVVFGEGAAEVEAFGSRADRAGFNRHLLRRVPVVLHAENGIGKRAARPRADKRTRGDAARRHDIAVRLQVDVCRTRIRPNL